MPKKLAVTAASLPLQQRLGLAVLAGLVGLAVNLLPLPALNQLWPSRVVTLPIAILFGPWFGTLATALAMRSAYLAGPGLLVAFGAEAVTVGLFARRGKSPIIASAIAAAVFAATLAVCPNWYGSENIPYLRVPLALQRLLNMMAAAVLADLVSAVVSARDLAGHQPAYHHRGLRAHFFHGFVVVAVLPVLVLSAVSAQVLAMRQESVGASRQHNAATVLASGIRDYVELHARAVESLADSLEHAASSPVERQQSVQSVIKHYSGFARVAIADRMGTLHEAVPPIALASIADRPFFHAAIETHRVAISDVLLGRTAPYLPRVFVAAPFEGKDGMVEGVVYGVLDLPVMSRFVEQYEMLPNTSVTIVDRQNQVIYAKGDDGYQMRQDLTNEPLVRASQSDRSYQYTRGGTKGSRTPYLAAAMTVDIAGWKVFVAQPLVNLQVQTWQYYASTLGLILAALLGAVLGARAFAGTVTHPLEELVLVVRNLSVRGGSVAAVMRSNPPAEIASLVEDVNSVQARLADSYRQLEQLTDQLDRKVTDRTAELAGANAVLKDILRALPGALLVADYEGIVRICNDTAATLLGRPMSELHGLRISELFSDEHPLLLDEIEKLDPDNDVLRCERIALTRTGEQVPVLVSAAVLQKTGGGAQQLRSICIAIDIRDRKKLELELNQAQKLESVGRLAAGVAHEINTPVQFVSDSVHFVREAIGDLAPVIQKYRVLRAAAAGAPDTADAVADVADAEKAADVDYLLANVPKALERSLEGLNRVAVIVRSMKEFAHPDQTEMAAIDLNQAIQSTLIIAQNEYKYVAEVITDLGEIPLVTCHAGDVNQVVLNLVVNAAHAIGDVVRGTEGKGQITVRTRRDGHAVVVSVGDTGGGIPEAVRARIFDPFFTTKEVGKGTGQGLAIARTIIVEKHGGELTFESQIGQGTTFLVRLPVDGKKPARPQVAA